MAIDLLAGLVKDYLPGVYKYFKSKFKPTTSKRLVFKAFKKELKEESKRSRGEGDNASRDFFEQLKKKIKKDKKNFPAVFDTDGNIINNPKEFFKEIKTPGCRKKLTEAIIGKYAIDKKFHPDIARVVNGSMERCLDIFMDAIDGEEAAKIRLRGDLSSPAEYPEETPGTPKRNQIKILSIMASPETDENENLYIDYEDEQDMMLDTFRRFDIDRVFPDMPDPVESTLDEIKKYLEDGAHHILHITAHGGTDEKGDGILYLEDHRGKAKPVTGAQLAAVLEPPPKIVILSACRSAQRSPNLVPAAEALFHAAPAVQVVIGMKTAISHLAAIDFNTAFLTALCEGETLKAAFEKGKDNIMKGEAKRREEINDWPYLNEHEVPRALWRDGGKALRVTDFSGQRIHAPGRPGSHDFLGARYLERGFIGRRGILRRIYRAVEDGAGAVVLKGPGGIGKSTLTTRAAAHLRRKGYDFMVVQGETSVERILEGLSKKAAAAGIQGVETIYAANAGEKEKLAWFVEQYLKIYPVVIIFDNFESNQDEGKQGAFFSEGLRDFLLYFRDRNPAPTAPKSHSGVRRVSMHSPG